MNIIASCVKQENLHLLSIGLVALFIIICRIKSHASEE